MCIWGCVFEWFSSDMNEWYKWYNWHSGDKVLEHHVPHAWIPFGNSFFVSLKDRFSSLSLRLPLFKSCNRSFNSRPSMTYSGRITFLISRRTCDTSVVQDITHSYHTKYDISVTLTTCVRRIRRTRHSWEVLSFHRFSQSINIHLISCNVNKMYTSPLNLTASYSLVLTELCRHRTNCEGKD
mgnify:CR=1 FL=1